MWCPPNDKLRVVCLVAAFCACWGTSNAGDEAKACGTKDGDDFGSGKKCGTNSSGPICPEGTSFDPDLGKCTTDRSLRKKHHKRQTAIVGIPCQENIDCQTTSGGAYCDSTKRCDCLPAYVNINSYCWQKSNPGESCLYLEQCTSVTPNAYCGTNGVCQCNNNQPPTPTYDGMFCVLPGECPTNGPFSKLRDPITGTDTACGGATGLGARECMTTGSSSNAMAAVYSCLCPNPQSNDYESACLSDQVQISYCCPVRAIACIQPRDEGSFAGGTPTSRWWYNSASGNCENLPYRGAGGNANNFQTRALCESYCKTACLRGAPLKSFDNTDARCSVSSPCGNPNYYCYTQGKSTYSLCCPTATFICNTAGGGVTVPAGIPDPVAPDEGESSYNGRNATRFAYNPNTQQCETFTYRGYGGTYNNFQTDTECRQYCSATVCNAGEPLRDSGGVVMQCGGQGSSICPNKYECSATGVCCPSVNFVCSQPQAIGACSNFAERWWFNPTTRSCEKFFYSGCQGNFNNFDTYQRCTDYCTSSNARPICPQGEAAKESGGTNYIVCSGTSATATTCPADYYCYFDGTRYGCCPTRTKTCSVDSLDQGTSCITPVTRWYYNSQTRLCEVFTYNGCDGNSNNFATKIDCQDYCGVGGCPEGGEPLRDTFNGQYRVCGTGGTDCPNGYSCNVVTLGTLQRYNYCCPTRAFICSMGQDQGQRCGTSTLNRYYFNVASRTCEMFTYNGCGGNRNNFASMEQCYMYCNSAGCPAGTVALQVLGTRTVTACDNNAANSCPSGYNCALSTVLQQGICCGSNAPPGSCPSGQLAYMDSFTSSPLQCQPNVDNSCPNGIFCQYSFALLNSFCCSSNVAQCPQGGSPYVETVGGQARQCTPGLPNACPSGYTCQSTTLVVGSITSATGYCCGQSNVCGAGYAPYYVNNQAVPCVPNQVPSSCVAPFTCRMNVMNQQGYCCVPSTQLTPVCAAGKAPYIVQGAPTLCAQNSVSAGCPGGYSCDLYQQTGSFYCCRFGDVINPPTPSASCPSGYTLLQPVQTCSPGGFNSCPTNYFCNYDALNLRYVCCGTGNIVPQVQDPCSPNNGQAYINPATQQAQMCALGAGGTGCPGGYSCAYSNALRNYYCCSRGPTIFAAQCPTPLVAAITAGGQVQTCVLGMATCPVGYTCMSTNTGGICCGQRTGTGGDPYGCPAGNAYLYPGTRTPLSCIQSGPACPLGYSCQRSTRANAFQCCSTGFGIRGVDENGIRLQTSDAQWQPAGSIQGQSGGRRCSNNWDCRDSNGIVRLCVNNRCAG